MSLRNRYAVVCDCCGEESPAVRGVTATDARQNAKLYRFYRVYVPHVCRSIDLCEACCRLPGNTVRDKYQARRKAPAEAK